MSHLLVTNDFPPKVGGIQAYLWELWRRLDPCTFTVLTASSHPDAAAFDAAARSKLGICVERVPDAVLLPTPGTARTIRAVADDTGASLVVLDPALPLGLVGPHVGRPYAVILHGAEVTVPGRIPGTHQMLVSVLAGASLAVCAGSYPAAEARRAAGRRMPATVEVPPGVDTERFRPLPAAERRRVRRRLGLPLRGPLVVSVSRLVPRKGMDVLIDAAAALVPSFPDLAVVVGGAGRDHHRLERRARRIGSPVRLLGAVPEHDLPELLACADLFVMACRNRWAGLEQEGFGIVFVEAAAAGVAQVAGRSGGADEAVVDGETGLVVPDASDPAALASAMRRLLADDTLRRRLGRAARRRAEASFDQETLAHRLAGALRDVGG